MIKDVFADEVFLKEILRECYRKFKSFVYYSNGLDYLKQKIAIFESNLESMNTTFERLAQVLIQEDIEYFKVHLKEVKAHVFPKSVITRNLDSNLVSNQIDVNKIEIKSVNFFIDTSIEIYIVDTLWTLCYGRLIVEDEENYKHHSAYQFDNSLYDISNVDFINSINFKSLNIYTHYFHNYIGWKNDAINMAEKLYNLDVNCMIFSLDISGYFYNVKLSRHTFTDSIIVNRLEIYEAYRNLNFLEDIIFHVYSKYSKHLSRYRKSINNNVIIPIGMVSSGIVSNSYLLNFDYNLSEITEIKYYKRYVDDILIVFENKADDISIACNELIIEKFPKIFNKTKNDYIQIRNFPNLQIQNAKIKVISILSNGSKSLIDTLRDEIGNASEPHLMPNISFGIDDFLKAIYKKKTDSLKIRDAISQEINPKDMMSFFASYLLSKKNTSFQETEKSKKKYESHDKAILDQISKVFTNINLINLFTRWSKIFAFAILADQKSELTQNLYTKVKKTIRSLTQEFEDEVIYQNKKAIVLKKLKNSLCISMEIALGLALSIRLYPKLKRALPSKLTEIAHLLRNSNLLDHKLISFPLYSFYSVKEEVPDLFTLSFEDARRTIIASSLDIKKVELSPRFIHLDEYSVGYSFLNIDKTNHVKYVENLYKEYRKILNVFGMKFTEHFDIDTYKSEHKNYPRILVKMGVKMSENVPEELFIALVNMNLSNHNMIPHGRINWIQCVTQRKRELYRILNESYFYKFEQVIKVRYPDRYHPSIELAFEQIEALAPVHFLLFPEVSVPYEWLSDLSTFSKKSGIAIVCGVKYVKINDHIINSVATILPSRTDDGHRYSILFLREKNDYSPEEKSLVRKNRLNLTESKNSLNYVFEWKKIRFSVFNCYELTDIFARATMKSKLDLLIATEYNKDVQYFSNIIESVSRDLFCYVAQVNSSQFGDTRIVAPKHSFNKLVASISGGERNSVHIGKINLKEFSDFQENEFTSEYIDYKKVKENLVRNFENKHKRFSGFSQYSSSSARTIDKQFYKSNKPIF